MSDKIIMLCVALAAVAVIAALFIHRVWRYKERMKQCVGTATTEANHPIPTLEELEKRAAKDTYLSRYISPIHKPFKGDKSVLIDPEYHDWIKLIGQIIGDNNVTIAAYVDNVLSAHFEEHREVINEIYSEKKRNKIS